MYSSSSERIWWPYASLLTRVMANLCVTNILNNQFGRRQSCSPSNQRIIHCRRSSLDGTLQEKSRFLSLRIQNTEWNSLRCFWKRSPYPNSARLGDMPQSDIQLVCKTNTRIRYGLKCPRT
jgi:hypothetical protein